MDRNTVVLSSPGHLVAALPHMIGFQPENSIVAVYIKDERVMLTQRADYRDAVARPEEFFGHALKNDPDKTVIVFYPDEDPATVDDYAVATFIDWANENTTIMDVLAVFGDRYTSLGCDDPECCPPEGTVIDPSLAAEWVLAGSAPAASRQEIEGEISEQCVREVFVPTCKMVIDYLAADQEAARDEYIARAVSIFYGDFDEEDLVAVACALIDIRVRDSILWHIANLDHDSLWEAYHLACQVASSVPQKFAAPAATVAATTAYILGDGARAMIALDYAKAADPDYSLAALVHMAVSSALAPTLWTASMRSLSFEEVRNGKENN